MSHILPMSHRLVASCTNVTYPLAACAGVHLSAVTVSACVRAVTVPSRLRVTDCAYVAAFAVSRRVTQCQIVYQCHNVYLHHVRLSGGELLSMALDLASSLFDLGAARGSTAGKVRPPPDRNIFL